MKVHSLSSLLLVLLFVSNGLAATNPPNVTIDLGTAMNFGLLAGSGITNVSASTFITGDVGSSPNPAVTGLLASQVSGTLYTTADPATAQAQLDLTVGYNEAAGAACGTVLTGTDLGGLTLVPGVYCFSSSALLTGTLTLDAQGDPNAQWVFQIGSTLTTATDSTVSIINGGANCNVYWQIGSSATIQTNNTFVGNILALTSITLDGGILNGRALARNGAVTMAATETVQNNFCNCMLGATLVTNVVKASGTLKVAIALQHRREATTRRSFLMTVSDSAGNTIVSQTTRAYVLHQGDSLNLNEKLVIPAGTPAGQYSLTVSIGGMTQAITLQKVFFTVD